MAPAQRGVTIKLFLVEGGPDGLWVVEKSNWTGIGLMCPRSSYPEARSREELARPGVYVLVGPSEQTAGHTRIYVGEADALSKRLDQHVKDKGFWTRAVVFTSKDQNRCGVGRPRTERERTHRMEGRTGSYASPDRGRVRRERGVAGRRSLRKNETFAVASGS